MKKFSKRTVLSILAAAGGVVLTSSLAVGMASCSVSENGTSQQQSFNLEAMIASQETNANFKIVSQSKNESVKVGEKLTLFVSTDSNTQSQLSFEWWQDKGNGWTKIQGGSFNTHEVDATRGFSTLTHQRYRVNIFDKTDASNSLWSEEINVTIVPNSSKHVTVTQQPASALSLKSGETAELSVKAAISNNAELKYQWFEDDGSGKGFKEISGATESTYSFQAQNSTTKDTVKKYLVRFADKADRTIPTKWLNESHVSVVTISSQSSKIEITSQSQAEQTITTTGAALLTVEAKHSEGKPLSYEWYVKKGDDGEFLNVQSGSWSYFWIHNLDIKDLDKDQKWEVYVDIFNRDDKNDKVKSGTFTVNIKVDSNSIPTPTPQPPLPEPGPSPLPTPTPTPQPEGDETIEIKLTSSVDSETIRPGQRVTLTAEATSSLTSNLKYQWYKCENGSTFEPIVGETNPTYTFNADSVSSNKKVIYQVTVTGAKISFESDYLELTIAPSNRLIAEKVSNPNGSISDNDLTLYGYQPNVNVNLDYTPKSPLGDAYKVNIRGNKSGITYQWYLGNYNGVWRDNADKIKIVGATQNTFTPDAEVFQKVHQEMGGRARVYCAIYKDGQLAAVAGNFTNFYLAVAAF